MSVARMPAVFFGHGNPMNALHSNVWTLAWARNRRGALRRRKRSSAFRHTGTCRRRRSRRCPPAHDPRFRRVSARASRSNTPRPASPNCAARSAAARAGGCRDGPKLGPRPRHLVCARACLPGKADVPVVQLSIDESSPRAGTTSSARKLAPLRDEGVLIMGSGNLVHNLHTYRMGQGAVEPYDWAVRFESMARKALGAGTFATLVATSRWVATRCCPRQRPTITCLALSARAAAARRADQLPGRRLRRRLDLDAQRADRLKRGRCDDRGLNVIASSGLPAGCARYSRRSSANGGSITA